MLFREKWVEKCGAYIVNSGCVARDKVGSEVKKKSYPRVR